MRATGRPRRPLSARRPSYAYSRAPREAAWARGPEYRPNRPPCLPKQRSGHRRHSEGRRQPRQLGPPPTPPPTRWDTPPVRTLRAAARVGGGGGRVLHCLVAPQLLRFPYTASPPHDHSQRLERLRPRCDFGPATGAGTTRVVSRCSRLDACGVGLVVSPCTLPAFVHEHAVAFCEVTGLEHVLRRSYVPSTSERRADCHG